VGHTAYHGDDGLTTGQHHGPAPRAYTTGQHDRPPWASTTGQHGHDAGHNARSPSAPTRTDRVPDGQHGERSQKKANSPEPGANLRARSKRACRARPGAQITQLVNSAPRMRESRLISMCQGFNNGPERPFRRHLAGHGRSGATAEAAQTR
jgi:hypothetical protein